LLPFNSKLSHFDKNLNKSQMAVINLEKTDVALIYYEARGHSELTRQIYGERFPQRILPNARTFVNVVQHLRNFGRFEMNKRDFGRQREDHKLKTSHEKYSASCKSPGSFSVFVRSGNSSKQRHSESSSAFLGTSSW
jgi:hypothetical protein